MPPEHLPDPVIYPYEGGDFLAAMSHDVRDYLKSVGALGHCYLYLSEGRCEAQMYGVPCPYEHSLPSWWPQTWKDDHAARAAGVQLAEQLEYYMDDDDDDEEVPEEEEPAEEEGGSF